MDVLKSPGLWLFLGALEALFLIHLAEFLYPGYSVSQNYISELGVGPTTPRLIFVAALVAFGLMILMAALLLREKSRMSKLWLLLAVSALVAIGVGVFNMDDFKELHGLSALLAFLFGNVAAVYSSRWVRPPFPCRPSKFRLLVEAHRSPGNNLSGVIARHMLQPASRHSNPASRHTLWSPSSSAWAFTAALPGTTIALTWLDTLCPRTTAAAALRSSIREFVHDPTNTRSIAMSVIANPGFNPMYSRA